MLVLYEDCCLPSLKESAKISSSVEKNFYQKRGQFLYWRRTACMISSIKNKAKCYHNQRLYSLPVELHFHGCKCRKHLLTSSKKNKLILKNRRYTHQLTNRLSNTSSLQSCLTLTEKSLTNSTDTRCPKS